jgi:hypothetical protein
MNLSIVDITPLPLYLSLTTERPPNTKEFNYKSLLIEDDGNYYYWSRGVSIKISQVEYQQVKSNPKLFNNSFTFNLHEKVSKVLGNVKIRL